ncbi:MAG TPA: threonine synthase, partial [Bacillota bacterium]|nr:threonine synthase [Bacillota bacterium]
MRLMRYSYLSHLECPKCGERHAADRIQGLCGCGSPLLARYDLQALKQDGGSPTMWSGRPKGLWRYHELLPASSADHVLTLGEGGAPFLPTARLGQALGTPDLWIEEEGLNPTGTFKARGAAVGVARARELGIKRVALPTAGNAGGAWAAYGAAAGIEVGVAMPADAPDLTKRECTAYGAKVVLVNGLIGDAGKIVARSAKEDGWFDAATLKEPYRIEGKKTMGLEIFDAFAGDKAPDVVVYPCGGGVGLIGIWKAVQELQALGWWKGPAPRMVAVQSATCAPIVKAYEERAKESQVWQGADTIAAGIRIPKALGDFLVLRAIYESEGCAVAVPDSEIRGMMRQMASLEGVFACPEGAAAACGVQRLRAQGWIKPG